MILACLTAAAAVLGADLESALALLDELDHIVVSANYHDVTLEEIVDDLNAQSPISIRTDWDELAGLGVDQLTSLTIERDSARLADVLGTIVATVDDGFTHAAFEAHAGEIVLTTADATASMTMTAVYDVRDLLAAARNRDARLAPTGTGEPDESNDATAKNSTTDDDEPGPKTGPKSDPESGPESDQESGDASHSASGGATGDESEADPEAIPPRTPGEQFMFELSDHVDPEAWIEYGGQRATFTDRDGVIVVTAPPSMHRRLQNALRDLRRATPSGVALHAAILDLPRSDYDRLTKRYGFDTAAGARAAMRDADARTLWQTDSVGSLDEAMAVSSAADGISISLTMTPGFTPDQGLLTMQVKAETVRGDDQRAVTTTVTFPATRGAAIIELPAAHTGETVRLLVLIPERI